MEGTVVKSKGIQKRRVARAKLDPQVSWPMDSHERVIRDTLARELLGVCISALESYGLNQRRLMELAEDAASGDRRTPATTKALQDIYWMGELISEWAESADYLDSEGRPQVIRIKGKGVSLTSLVHKFFDGRSVEEILKLGCQTQVMERIGHDKVARFNSCVMFTGNPLLTLAHSTRSVRRFLRSASYNAWTPNDPAHSLPEQTAFNAVPEEDFPEFVRVMREQISSILEMGNRWLTSRATASRLSGSGKKVTIGIQAFVFRE